MYQQGVQQPNRLHQMQTFQPQRAHAANGSQIHAWTNVGGLGGVAGDAMAATSNAMGLVGSALGMLEGLGLTQGNVVIGNIYVNQPSLPLPHLHHSNNTNTTWRGRKNRSRQIQPATQHKAKVQKKMKNRRRPHKKSEPNIQPVEEMKKEAEQEIKRESEIKVESEKEVKAETDGGTGAEPIKQEVENKDQLWSFLSEGDSLP